MQTSTIRPGLLVSLKTSIRGNISYDTRDIEREYLTEDGKKFAKWETERTIADPAEYEEAKKIRSKVRSAISGICAKSAFGLLCPENAAENLDKAITEARRLADEFNTTAKLTRLGVYVIAGRITPDAQQRSKSTMRKLTKAEMIDGFDTDDTEQNSSERRVIQGTRLKFSNDFCWIDDNESEIPKEQEFIVADRARVLQKWGPDQTPLETRWLEPGETVDVKQLNQEAPKSEWRDGPSGPTGPWQLQWLIFLFDPQTAGRFTYPTSTIGGNIAIGDLSERIKRMRWLRGQHVYPVVCLRSTHMKTKFGSRQRPHFEIVRWVQLGGDGSAALPGPEKPLLTDQAVKEPSLKEETRDEVPY
jgi:hypothetical protein